MPARKKRISKKTITVPKVKETAAKDTLVHIQSSEDLVMRLKIIAASRNQKMYQVVNEALTQWLHNQSAELETIAGLFSNFERDKDSLNA